MMLPDDTFHCSCAHGDCDTATVWRRVTRVGHDLFSYDFFCERHAEIQENFSAYETARANPPIMWAWFDGVARVWIARSGDPFVMFVDKPFSVRDFIDKARVVGHDAFGIANDPEATVMLETTRNARESVNHHTREPHQPIAATIVEGEYCNSNNDPGAPVPYVIALARKGPGQVEFTLTIDGQVHGKLPFDNLVKAATRIDPDYAAGAEKQIRELRGQTAKARAETYDWRAKAEQAEAKLVEADAKLQALQETMKA